MRLQQRVAVRAAGRTAGGPDQVDGVPGVQRTAGQPAGLLVEIVVTAEGSASDLPLVTTWAEAALR